MVGCVKTAWKSSWKHRRSLPRVLDLPTFIRGVASASRRQTWSRLASFQKWTTSRRKICLIFAKPPIAHLGTRYLDARVIHWNGLRGSGFLGGVLRVRLENRLALGCRFALFARNSNSEVTAAENFLRCAYIEDKHYCRNHEP